MAERHRLDSGIEVTRVGLAECVLSGPQFVYLFEYPYGHAVSTCIRTDEPHRRVVHEANDHFAKKGTPQ
jgi:hypothetical protein